MRRLLLALVLAVPVAAHAQDDDKGAKEAEQPTEQVQGNLSLKGDKPVDAKYQGVVPGGQALPPRAPKLPLRKGPQRMTWSGFQVQNGVPTVFLEVTGDPQYSVDDAPGELTVTLKNTVVPIRNNRRALQVAQFDTPVQVVETSSKGHETRVTIKVKGTTKPAHHERVENAAGGFRMLVIELQ
jgi:hypothetical protein